MSGDDRGRGALLVIGAIVASVVLVGAYLAAGGSSYEPKQVQDPCEPREWSDPQGLQGIAQQFSLSALDGAACQLGVSRETLAQYLFTEQGRERFKNRFGISDARLARAIRAGLIRAVDDAEEAGALSPLLGVPLRETLQRIPLDEAIELIDDARSLLGDVESFLGPATDIIEELLP